MCEKLLKDGEMKMSSEILVFPRSSLKGELLPPGDKSISHRAVMIGSIAEGVTEITNFLSSEDCLATIRAFSKMGVKIETISNNHIRVYGTGLEGLNEPNDILDMGNSGTSMRLIAGILAGQPFYSVLTGDSSLRSRPMNRIAEPLRLMGAKVYARKGDFAPITIIGDRLKGIDYKTQVSSAQVKSCILLAGLYAEGQTSVTEAVKSRDHTERMLKAFGADISCENLSVRIKGRSKLSSQSVTIPGDISSAAYFIVSALICPDSELIIKNVGVNQTRTGIIDALRMMGGQIEIYNYREESSEPVADIYVRSSELRSAQFSGDMIVRMIDEIPILALAGTQAEGQTVIQNASELRVKESDRISVTTQELKRIGADIEELEDGMIIRGKTKLKGGKCYSHGDHRIAMTLAIAGLISQEGTRVNDIECINTSFPDFWNMLNSIGSNNAVSK